MHGERPSAEYAQQRKQSLEEEFGHVLGTYSSRSVSVVYRFGPFLALFRAAVISYYVLKLSIWQLFVDDIHKRAMKVSCGPLSFLFFSFFNGTLNLRHFYYISMEHKRHAVSSIDL